MLCMMYQTHCKMFGRWQLSSVDKAQRGRQLTANQNTYHVNNKTKLRTLPPAQANNQSVLIPTCNWVSQPIKESDLVSQKLHLKCHTPTSSLPDKRQRAAGHNHRYHWEWRQMLSILPRNLGFPETWNDDKVLRPCLHLLRCKLPDRPLRLVRSAYLTVNNYSRSWLTSLERGSKERFCSTRIIRINQRSLTYWQYCYCLFSITVEPL